METNSTTEPEYEPINELKLEITMTINIISRRRRGIRNNEATAEATAPVISQEESVWFAHNMRFGLVAEINPGGMQSTAYIEYGSTTAYGTTIELDEIETGSTNVVRTAVLPALTPGTYHWRVVATNHSGVTTGTDQTFVVYPGTNREQTEYTLPVMEGTTYFIDPTAASNGNGLAAETPFNAWPATIGGNNIYCQKAGTTASFASTFRTINGNCTIKAYGEGTQPVIACTATSSADTFRFITTNGYQLLMDNVKVTKPDITGVGVYVINAPDSIIHNCEIEGWGVPVYTQGGGGGLNVQWTGFKLLYSTLHGCGTDGTYLRYTTGIEVGHCYIYDINRAFLIPGNEHEDNSPGDNIQAATAGSLNINIHHCTLDHSNTGNKFNVIVACEGATISMTHNHLIGTKEFEGHLVSGVYLTPVITSAYFYGNVFENHNLGIYNGGTNIEVNYNIFINSNKAIACPNNRSVIAYNNVFYNFVQYAIERLSGGGVTAKNNVFVSNNIPAFNLSGTGTDSIDYNHFYGTTASGTNSTTGDPLFTDAASRDFYPLTDSPLIASGTDVSLTTDFDLQAVSETEPCKGAFEFVAQ